MPVNVACHGRHEEEALAGIKDGRNDPPNGSLANFDLLNLVFRVLLYGFVAVLGFFVCSWRGKGIQVESLQVYMPC